PVALGRCAYLTRVKQSDLRCGRPLSAVAVAATDGLQCDPAVFAPRASQEPVHRVVGKADSTPPGQEYSKGRSALMGARGGPLFLVRTADRAPGPHYA